MPTDDRQWVIDAAKTVPGVLDTYHLVDPDTGNGMSIAFLDDGVDLQEVRSAISTQAEDIRWNTVPRPAPKAEQLFRVPRGRPLPAAWLVGHPANTATAYRRDLQAWSTWCAEFDVHPLAAERHHVDAWVRHLTTNRQPRTGRPALAATVARKLSALAGFYDYGLHYADVLSHSPVASVRRSKVTDESQAIGLTTDELKRLLAAAEAHSPRAAALVSVLTFCGLRISEALGADVRDYSHDQGHRVLKVTRKGGKAAAWHSLPRSSEPSTPTSRSAPADRCFSYATAAAATPMAARMSS